MSIGKGPFATWFFKRGPPAFERATPILAVPGTQKEKVHVESSQQSIGGEVRTVSTRGIEGPRALEPLPNRRHNRRADRCVAGVRQTHAGAHRLRERSE